MIVPPAVAATAGLARLAHPPFRAADAEETATAAGLGATAPLEAACLALLYDAPLIVAGAEFFPDLVPLSAWSMNVPARPTDGLLVRHLAIAARVRGAVAAGAAAALEAIRTGDTKGLDAIARARRRAARADGPARFRRIAKTSAGLRPFAIYLDLVPSTLAAGGEARRTWMASLDPAIALRLLDVAVALFV